MSRIDAPRPGEDGTPRFRIAEIYLFDTCTHRCGYCWLAESGQVLDAEQLKPFRDPAFIHKVAEFFNSRTTADVRWELQFTGGEPLLAPNLGLLCRTLFEKGNRVAFYSALLLPESHPGFRFLLAHGAPEVDYVMASLHPEAELDVDTYFRKVERLKARGHRVIVRYVGHPARLGQLHEVQGRCRDLDVAFYPTTLFSNVYPAAYQPEERTALSSRFSSLSQHVQLAGGLQTDHLSCHAGDRLIAVNLQTGNITPCITIDRPSLGNLFANTLTTHQGPSQCPVQGITCACDVHFQQGVVVGADDRDAFARLKRGYVEPGAPPELAAKLSSLQFFSGSTIGIGSVEDVSRLFFTKEEVKARHQARDDRRIDSLGAWSVNVDTSGAGPGRASVTVTLRNARSLSRIELFVNVSGLGDTGGEWKGVYSDTHTGSNLDLTVPLAIDGFTAGTHRVALNVHFDDGSTCYWYAQPPHFMVVGRHGIEETETAPAQGQPATSVRATSR